MASPVDDTLQRLEVWRQRTQTADTQVGDDPVLPARIGLFGHDYWWMDPGAIFSLAKAGIDATSPTAAAAAHAAARIEVNSGLGFAKIGSPATRPNEAPDVTSILRGLDQPTAKPTPDPAQYAAGQPGPLQQVAGADWAQLSPSEQAELSKIQITKANPGDQWVGMDFAGAEDARQQVLAAEQGATVYKVEGWDQLQPFWQQKVAQIIGKTIGVDNPDNSSTPNAYTGSDGWFDRGFLVSGHETALGAAMRNNAQLDVLGSLSPIVRPAFMVSSAPLQEVTGEFRNLYALVHGKSPNFLESQSDLGVAVGDLLHGRNVDVGTGLFVDPNSPVGQERERRLQERGTISGHGITFGRALADVLPDSVAGVHVFEPGSKPYAILSGIVDAAAAIKLDPTAKALKEGNAIRQADKNLAYTQSSVLEAGRALKGGPLPALRAFEEAGGLRGIRPVVDPEAASVWLDSPEQLPVLERFAAEKDPYNVYRALGRNDPALAVQIADAGSADEVASVLRPHLGISIREKFATTDLPTTGYTSPSRWVANMPGSSVKSDSLAANALELERAASLTKAPDAQLHVWFDRMARTTDEFERLGAWEQVMDDTAERLVGKGIPAQRAKDITRLWREQATVEKVYSQDRVGKGLGMFDQQAVVDGQVITTRSSPHLLAQHLDGQIPLPDWRVLRRTLSPLRPILENPALQGTEHLLMAAQNKVWKALQVATVKTMIKVLADDQAKMVASGYVGLPNHPIRAVSMILATPLSELPEDAGFLARMQHSASKTLRWSFEEALPHPIEAATTAVSERSLKAGAGKMFGTEAALTKTVTGEDFQNLWEIQQVASHGFDTVADDPLGMIAANNWQEIQQAADNVPEFTGAWSRDVAQYAASPESRGFVQAGSLPQAKAWWWEGPGKKFRETLAKGGEKGHPELLTKQGADQFVELTLQQVTAKTNGNPQLLDAIANGRLDGTPLWMATEDGTLHVSQRYVEKMSDYLADAPQVTRAPKMIYSADKANRQVLDNVVHRLLHTLLGTPSAVLSKSPLFRQAYWEDIIEKAPFMTADAQNEVLRIARNEANIGSKLTNELSAAVTSGNAKRTPFSGTVTLEHADTMAKGRGLEVVEFLTDEATNRSQLFDTLRILTPFGEVWRKTIRRWGHIINENPQVVRRGQQGWDAAHGADLGAVLGTPAGQGFFHKDQYGQEVFSIPGSEWATQALAGVPVPLVGNVQGLSLGTEFFPSLGPVASIPVAWTMEKLHAPPDITQIIFPFGPPKQWNDLLNYMPSWFARAVGHDRPTSPDAVRTFDNSIIDIVRLGQTTGEYDTNTPEGIQHAIEDATGKAHKLNWVRGAAQYFIPGAPSPQMLLQDKSGQMLDAAVVVQDFRRLQDEDPNTAGQRFLDKYGAEIFKAATSKSYAYVFGVPTSKDSAAWVDDHPELRRDFPHVYGYFAPPSDPTKFDYSTYLQQINRGERVPLKPEQWAHLANARLAGLQYGALRDKVDAASGGKLNDALRLLLAQKKQQLMDEYPGYADSLYGGSGLPSRPDPKLLVREVSAAAKDPLVTSTDAGKGLVDYLAVRDKVDAAWVAAGYSSGSWATSTGANALALRGVMRQIGAQQETAHPQFGPLFESVFSREMRDDTNPADLVTVGGG